MLSRADGSRRVSRRGPRVYLERAAHAIALAIVVWLLVQSLRRPSGGSEAASLSSLPASLARWSTVGAPEQVHVRIDGDISPVQRDWLAALGGAGTHTSWEGEGLQPVAAVARPIADPVGATGVWTAAPAGATVILSDRVGVLDSVRTGAIGARFLARSAPNAVRVRASALTARSAVSDSLTLKRLLVLGRVGWESKFVTASLEERGWEVDARLVLSPKGDVVQGDDSPIDTAYYAAVIALDSTALAVAAKIVSYVRSGGGLVVAGPPAAARALAPLRVGTLGALLPAAVPFDSVAFEPRRALALTPILPGASSVVIESRDSMVAVASRRVERGRVTVVGYQDTWRWRMGGGDDALEQYREWWSHLVAGVADVGRVPRAPIGPTDEAPLAHLVQRLGPQSSVPPGSAPRRPISPGWLFGVLAGALLLEWASRRLRGAP